MTNVELNGDTIDAIGTPPSSGTNGTAPSEKGWASMAACTRRLLGSTMPRPPASRAASVAGVGAGSLADQADLPVLADGRRVGLGAHPRVERDEVRVQPSREVPAQHGCEGTQIEHELLARERAGPIRADVAHGVGHGDRPQPERDHHDGVIRLRSGQLVVVDDAEIERSRLNLRPHLLPARGLHVRPHPLGAGASHHPSAGVHPRAVARDVRLQAVDHQLRHATGEGHVALRVRLHLGGVGGEEPPPERGGLAHSSTLVDPIVQRIGSRVCAQRHVRQPADRPRRRTLSTRQIHRERRIVGAAVSEVAAELDQRVLHALGGGSQRDAGGAAPQRHGGQRELLRLGERRVPDGEWLAQHTEGRRLLGARARLKAGVGPAPASGHRGRDLVRARKLGEGSAEDAGGARAVAPLEDPDPGSWQLAQARQPRVELSNACVVPARQPPAEDLGEQLAREHERGIGGRGVWEVVDGHERPRDGRVLPYPLWLRSSPPHPRPLHTTRARGRAGRARGGRRGEREREREKGGRGWCRPGRRDEREGWRG
eukprot:scaffold222674_cov24-Tisochrysis_lutea.AAC.3